MNTQIINNSAKLKWYFILFPLLLLALIVLFLYLQDSLSPISYIEIQKKYFYEINARLSQFPNLIYNLTQLGDALIFLSLLSVFIIHAPKLWENLISASIFSLIFSNVLKNIFSVPRPAEAFDNHTFNIIGKTLVGYSSLPSGHSITVFTFLTVLMYAFMPKKIGTKILWISGVIILGASVAFTRVGVGAHHPLDVITGSILGYLSGILGILFNKKYSLWSWINQKKYYPFFILLFFSCSVILINKILHENLIVYYFSLISLLFSLYKIMRFYVQK